MARLLSVLEIVSQASLEIGLTQQPVQVAVGSPDQDISQMVALLSAVADEVLLDQPYKTTLGDGYWVFDAGTMEAKNAPTLDTDLVGFDGRLAIVGLKFRLLKAKGLEFGEEMRDFISRLNKLAGRVNARVLDLNEDAGRVV